MGWGWYYNYNSYIDGTATYNEAIKKELTKSIQKTKVKFASQPKIIKRPLSIRCRAQLK